MVYNDRAVRSSSDSGNHDPSQSGKVACFQKPNAAMHNLGTVMWGGELPGRTSDICTDRDSIFVCCRCEYVTFSFPTLSNAAVIEPSFNPTPDFASTSRAAWTSFVRPAASIASSPQQIFACRRKLLVDVASPVFKYRRTCRPFFPFPLQCFAIHSKT